MPIDERELGMLIRVLNPYSTHMEHSAGPVRVGALTPPPSEAPDLGRFHVELDDYSANYSTGTWTFRGAPQTIKKAIRIAYRYPVMDADNRPTGVYATEHLLIGYAGSNSG